MLYYLVLSLLTVDAALLLHICIWRRKHREEEAKRMRDARKLGKII